MSCINRENERREARNKVKIVFIRGKKYELNHICEEWLVASFILLQQQKLKSESITTNIDDCITIADILQVLSQDIFGSDIHRKHAKCIPTKPQLG